MSKAKKIIVCFLGAFLVACSSLTALGATDYFFTFAQPQIDSTSGYLEIVFSNSGPCVIYFTVVDRGSPCPDSVMFKAYVSNNNLYISGFNGNTYTVDGLTYPIYKYGYLLYPDGNGNSLTFDSSFNLSLYLGNVGSVVSAHGYNCYVEGIYDNNCTFSYGSDYVAITKLAEIKALIEAQQNVANSNAQAIQNNADKNANNIQSNNDKNTQSIIDNQNQLAEQEKTETQNSGNDSVSDVSGSVPDKSAGMLSALQSLSNAVSYTGTSAKWTFPQMYIPAIAGVTDRINLNPEMEVDFTYWVNQIPQDIRTLISALATIGLVIFAFKELYGFISYVLTLKGGGNNE